MGRNAVALVDGFFDCDVYAAGVHETIQKIHLSGYNGALDEYAFVSMRSRIET